jgi:hypothetical protein
MEMKSHPIRVLDALPCFGKQREMDWFEER